MDLGETVGLIGGSLAIARTIWDFYQTWKNRGKIEVNVLRLSYFLDKFGERTGPMGFVGPPGHRSGTEPLDGKGKNSFTILEVEIVNGYKRPMTITRVQIDDWMFSERYHQHMYDRLKDYRVFDLYTGQPTSLASSHLLPPDNMMGLRVEIVEQSDGPFQESNHRYVGIPERKEYVIRLEYSRGALIRHIPIGDPTETYFAPSGRANYPSKAESLRNFAKISRWSEQQLIPGGQPDSAGEPKP